MRESVPPTRILNRTTTEALVTYSDVVSAVEQAFVAHARGETHMPPKVYLDLPEYGGDFRAMPCSLGKVAGVKWVNAHPRNPTEHGLPSVMGVYVLSDAETAVPLAVLDATWITAARTGAAAAVASKYLGRKSPARLGFIGCGVQARTMLACHRALFGEALAVFGYDRDPDKARGFADEVGGAVGSLEEVAACDLLCASTPARTPVLPDRLVQAGTHINAMGADGPGKQELDAAILRRARVFIDEWEQASHSGEINVPLTKGTLKQADLAGTLGQVVAGQCPGRQTEADITVFDSTGLAVQDLAVAQLVYQRALDQDQGVVLELV